VGGGVAAFAAGNVEDALLIPDNTDGDRIPIGGNGGVVIEAEIVVLDIIPGGVAIIDANDAPILPLIPGGNGGGEGKIESIPIPIPISDGCGGGAGAVGCGGGAGTVVAVAAVVVDDAIPPNQFAKGFPPPGNIEEGAAVELVEGRSGVGVGPAEAEEGSSSSASSSISYSSSSYE